MSSAKLPFARLSAVVALAMIGACMPFGEARDGIYRDVSVPIGATTRFDTAQFAGEWFIVARFGETPEGRVVFTQSPARNALSLASDVIPERAGTYEITRAGVLESPRAPGDTLIVMWVDEGFRTAAIGTGEGDFGVILNRQGAAPADRLEAAVEVLDFYGWDTSQLKGAQP
ncbi:hypothetical protein ROLI_014880 [Roseobacter fucihabitans]|uniref:Apolipoprotein D and lipocalin family protein n=1 Tax=Roseobacter fucihabitans TaxID=1537242 RepID=A0ABZ2BR36_9RHOB|nr:hypothetical protein [Roseobacter litoralis]MBC6967939.1 hypothetical protein [Roseobacter litoralis]